MLYPILGVVIITSLGYGLYDWELPHSALIALGVGLCLISPSFYPVMIICAYEALYAFLERRSKEWCVFVVGCVILIIVAFTRGGIAVGRLAIAAYCISTMISIYLAIQCNIVNRQSTRIINLTDESVDRQNRLMEQNRLVLKSQDDALTMATLQERNRIAREIHDNVGHLLSRSIIQVGALQTICKDEPAATFLTQISDTLNESMTNIRSSVHNLHNESIDLYGTIKGIAERNEKVNTTIDYSVDSDLPIKIKYAFISIITEGFENFRKHSDGDSIRISVNEHPAFYQMVFVDNGHPKAIHESGIGLHNMQARVDELNGILSIDTTHGFKIFISIPKIGEQ